jgi:hypothetical protein
VAGAGRREQFPVTFAFLGAAVLACYWVEGLHSVSLPRVGIGLHACALTMGTRCAVQSAVGSAPEVDVRVHVLVHVAGGKGRQPALGLGGQ